MSFPSILCPGVMLMPQQHQTFSWLCVSWLLTLDLVSLVLETCLTLSPHFLQKTSPVLPTLFSFCFTSQMCFDSCQCFSKTDFCSCVCLYWLLCVFPTSCHTLLFLGQVGNLEGCGKVTFGLWKEMEPAPYQTGKWWATPPVANSC